MFLQMKKKDIKAGRQHLIGIKIEINIRITCVPQRENLMIGKQKVYSNRKFHKMKMEKKNLNNSVTDCVASRLIVVKVSRIQGEGGVVSHLHRNIPGPLFKFLGETKCDPTILYTA